MCHLLVKVMHGLTDEYQYEKINCIEVLLYAITKSLEGFLELK